MTAETLSELANDKKYLGAQIGFFSLLHTWSQDIRYHPHIHTVVMAGGLTRQNRWQMSSRRFFIPVKVLAKKFRGKFLHYLNQYYREGRLHFYGAALMYQDGDHFAKLLGGCYAKEWYVYTKRTFSGPVAVVRYLGQYTHRIAISNSRVLGMDADKVIFTVKDREHKNREKTVTVQGTEFVRRFLMHILPRGFVKIRHYGILANRNKKTKLKLCRRLTCSPSCKPRFEGLTTIQVICMLFKKDVTICPVCGKGRMKLKESLCPQPGP